MATRQEVLVLDEGKSGSLPSLTCQICSSNSFTNNANLRQHCYTSHNLCIDCDMQLKNRNETLNHLNTKHGKRIKCDYGSSCNFQGFDFELKMHFKTVHRQPESKNLTFSLQYKCKMCPSVQIYEADLNHHYAWDHNYCNLCRTMFGTQQFVCDHMTQQHNFTVKKIHRCKFCYEALSSVPELDKHYSEVHFFCDECDETMLNAEGMFQKRLTTS